MKKPVAGAAGSSLVRYVFVIARLAASESVCVTVSLSVVLAVGTVAIATVLILVLILPKIARLTLVRSAGLIAILPAEISTLVKASVSVLFVAEIATLVKTSVSVLFEVASITLPVVAVIEAVVKARRNLVTAVEWLPVPISSNPCIASVVLRPIAINPGVVRARTWWDVVCVRRRRLVEPGALSSEAYADRESRLREHRTSSQEHHRQQFRFH